MTEAAATLFRRNGYAATGINEIAEVAGAPKGSLYHYFPDGKDQIGEAAVRFAGKGVVATLEKLEQEHRTAAAMMQAYCRLLAGWMAKSGFRDGCPISTTLLESAPQSEAIAFAGREAFAEWRAVIARALIRDGFSKQEARRLSTLRMFFRHARREGWISHDPTQDERVKVKRVLEGLPEEVPDAAYARAVEAVYQWLLAT